MQKEKHLFSELRKLCLLSLLMIASAGLMFAQVNVTGVVTDADGETLVGVNVIERGTAHGTITDIDGKFALDVASPNSYLVFSYVGFTTQEVQVGNTRNFNIVLQLDMETLEEIVVVGYGTQAKKDITGSVAVVNTEDLLITSGSSATQQLQGKTPGVYIGQTGSPGSATMVRIRGVNTVNDNGPLYVIDGVATRNQNLSSLNPNDIASMQVLKDASSAAIYGAQAANGVILITTKSGSRTGAPKLTYDAYYGMQKTTSRYDLVNSMDRLNLEWEAQNNSFLIRGTKFDEDGNERFPTHPQFGTGPTPKIPNYMTTTGANGRTDININDYSFPNNQMVKFSDTDWWDEVDRTAPIQNHQLSLVGGNDRGQYLLGLNYFDQQGTVIHSYFKRYQTRINTSFDIRKWFRVGQNLQFTYTKDQGLQSSSSEASAYSYTYRPSPWVPVKDEFGNWAGSKIAGTGNFVNVVARETRNKDNYWVNTRLFGNLWAELDLMKDLTFRTSFGLDHSTYWGYNMSKKDPEFSESPGTNYFNEEANSGYNLQWQNTLTYSKRFGDVHSLTVLLGSDALRGGLGRTLRGRRYNYLFEDNIDTWTLQMGENNNQRQTESWYWGETALFGVFGRVDYGFADKYLFTGIVRRDGASRFSQSQRYGTFPSASFGWRVSEEAFMENTRDWLDDLKLRVGYGLTGNSEIPRATNFASLFTTTPDRTNYDLSGANTGTWLGYRLSTYGNPETRWEATKQLNLGLDITFGQGRFNSTLEFYNKETSDMLIGAAYSNLAGEPGTPYINYGSMRNRGFDFAFNYADRKGDLGWDIALNLSRYENEVLSLAAADDYAIYQSGVRISDSVTRTIKGEPISHFFGYNVIGFYESEQDVLSSPTPYGTTASAITSNPGSYVGKFKFEDVNGDGKIDSSDRTIIGNPHPDLVGGLNVGLTYKNFDFTMFWYSSIGNDLFNNTKYFTDFPLFGGNRSTRMRDLSWKPGADNSKAILPILDSNDSWGGAVSSSYYVEDGSFLKLKNLVLGYTLPQDLVRKATIERLRLYIQAENVLSFDSYTGLDPEFTNADTGQGSGADLRRGLDMGGWPTTMRLLFGVNFTF